MATLLGAWRYAVIRAPELVAVDRYLALVLSTYMSSGDGGAFPSITELAHTTRLARRTVQYHLRALEESGWIVTIPSKGGRRARAGEATTNRYRATFPPGYTPP